MSVEINRRFEIAGGSVPGRAHALLGRANQDAFVCRVDEESIIAVVADGCGGAEHSEVGAWVGAHAVVAEIARAVDAGQGVEEGGFWEGVRSSVLGSLGATARGMGGGIDEVIGRFFLFTVVGVAVFAERAVVFSVGDGLVAINGEVTELGPFPGNAPPYLGHDLLDAGAAGFAADGGRAGTRFVVHRVMDLREVESVVIATDGAVELRGLEGRKMPGGREVVGPLSELWKNDRFFANPDALRRRLACMNRPFARPVWEDRRMAREPGLLEDDTTIVVLRARRNSALSAA